MRPTLYLVRTNTGEPRRLKFKCQPEDKAKAKRAGLETARWNTKMRAWSYPIDPVVVRKLMDEFGDELHIDADLEGYLNTEYERQLRIMEATQDTSSLGNGLWSFQCGSVRFLAEVKKGILGHQMGTGKTPICCVALDYVVANRVLIVCPNSV